MSNPGRFVNLELLTASIEKTIPFLVPLLGLEILFVEGESPFFGLAKQGVDVPYFGILGFEPDPAITSHWIGYLAVDDPAAAAATAVELGGAVYLAPEAPEDFDDDADVAPLVWLIGDPQGAVFALVPRAAQGIHVFDTGADLGSPAWFELTTNAVEAAAGFYAAVLGWEFSEPVDRGEEGLAREIYLDGHVYGVIRQLQSGSPRPPHWVPFLRVAALDAALGKVRGFGGFFFEDAAVVPGGRRAIVLEPTGADIGLWQAAG